jgi:penicillin-binding protein 2
MYSESTQSGSVRPRLTLLTVFITVVFSLLVVYLFYLQVVRGVEYRELSKNVAFREITIPTQRGEIYDRNYDKPLVMNVEAFALQLTPGQVTTDKLQYFERLARFLEIDASEIQSKVPSKSYLLFQPIEICPNVSFEKISYIAEHKDNFPGISWNSKLKREYIETGSLSHVIGYVGGIDESELELMYNQGYDRNSIIGKTGIEKKYDTLLRGKDGKRFRLTDVQERGIGKQTEEIAPVLGNHLVLTIDKRIQKLCENTLSKRTGAAVVLKPSTGEILALVSVPWFNPNRILENEYYDKLRLDPKNPLYNRALSQFPPASAFKVVMASAILEENAFPPEKIIFCSGVIYVGDRAFHCWVPAGHGALNLKGAITNSCNNYFQTVGVNYLGPEKIIKYARDYGFGEQTGIDLFDEKSGFVPTPEWKEDNERMIWLGGDTANLSIGQGYISVTPLQMADMVSMVVNRGTVYKPHVLKEVRNPVTGNAVTKTNPEVLRRSSFISQKTFITVAEGMREVVLAGTARYVMTTTAVKIAGKTGTSELGPDKKDKTHEWFAGFGPYDALGADEQLVVVVFVENVPKNEWWAPRIANYIFHGIFTNKSLEEVEADLGKLYWQEEEKKPE